MSGEKVYFVVMRNFLPVKMQYKFDLKGATFKRNALTNQQMHKELLAKQQCTLLESEWMDAMVCRSSIKCLTLLLADGG